jgi:flagellar M-ring protein FliF
VQASLKTARAWFAALSRPARVLLFSTLGVAALIGGFLTFQKVNEPYAALFSQLDREDAAAIVAKLKELKVPYRVEGDGASIEVPESRAHELRLELAGGGLPRGGGVGFESFDKMRLGATDFEQRVLYRRALEGELTRTIATLGAVESSRVHLVLPEKSVFVTRSEPASASIVLRLRPGRSVGASEVAAVVHLVASAVPSLQPDHIAVVTTEGVTLHRPHKSAGDEDELGGGGDDDARTAARSYESSIEDRVRSMLEKVVGPGHADVRVTADVDSARVEHIEEHFDPSRAVLRSEEQSVERSGGELEDTVAGVPGAESNLPNGAAKGSSNPLAKPAASAAPSAAAALPSPSGSAAPTPPPAAVASSNSVRESHTRNYEIDKVSEKRVSAGAALKRLAVAVVLDDVRDGKVVPRTQAELDKLAALVRSAAGTNDARGDLVTVQSMTFADSLETPAEAPKPSSLPLAKLVAAKRWWPAAAAAVVLVGIGVGLAVRRRAPRVVEVAAPLQLAAPATPPALAPAAIGPVLDSADLRTRAHSRAAQDPATAALVLRFWLGTSSPEAGDAPKA